MNEVMAEMMRVHHLAILKASGREHDSDPIFPSRAPLPMDQRIAPKPPEPEEATWERDKVGILDKLSKALKRG